MNEAILRELRIHAEKVQINLNMELSDVLNDNFQELLKKAVTRMENERRTSAADVNLAKEAVEKVLNTMYPLRETRFGQKSLVRMQDLNESKSSICPLWPIC